MPLDTFAEFYETAFPTLHVQLTLFTGDPAQARKAASRAFERAAAQWRRLSTDDDPTAWVRREAWRTVRRRQHAPLPDARWAALNALPAPHRQAAILAQVAGLNTHEIADLTGATEKDVASWLTKDAPDLADLARTLRSEPLPPTSTTTIRAGLRRRRLTRTAATTAVLAAVALIVAAYATRPPVSPPHLPAAEAISLTATTLGLVGPITTSPPPAMVGPSPPPSTPDTGDGPGFGQTMPTQWTDEQRCSFRVQQTKDDGYWFTFTYRYDLETPSCASVPATITYAGYTFQPDGSAKLYSSKLIHFTQATPTASIHPDVPATCHAWFFMKTQVPVLPTIPASQLGLKLSDPRPYSDSHGAAYQFLWYIDDLKTCPMTATPPVATTTTPDPPPTSQPPADPASPTPPA